MYTNVLHGQLPKFRQGSRNQIAKIWAIYSGKYEHDCQLRHDNIQGKCKHVALMQTSLQAAHEQRSRAKREVVRLTRLDKVALESSEIRIPMQRGSLVRYAGPKFATK